MGEDSALKIWEVFTELSFGHRFALIGLIFGALSIGYIAGQFFSRQEVNQVKVEKAGLNNKIEQLQSQVNLHSKSNDENAVSLEKTPAPSERQKRAIDRLVKGIVSRDLKLVTSQSTYLTNLYEISDVDYNIIVENFVKYHPDIADSNYQYVDEIAAHIFRLLVNKNVEKLALDSRFNHSFLDLLRANAMTNDSIKLSVYDELFTSGALEIYKNERTLAAANRLFVTLTNFWQNSMELSFSGIDFLLEIHPEKENKILIREALELHISESENLDDRSEQMLKYVNSRIKQN